MLTKVEFPLEYGLSLARRNDIAVQDLLHNIKKCRNNLNYLSTSIPLFIDPANLDTGRDRLMYTATWKVVIKMYEDCAEFKRFITKSSVAVSDKMDPSPFTELEYT